MRIRQEAISNMRGRLLYSSYEDRSTKLRQAYETLGPEKERLMEYFLPEFVDEAIMVSLQELFLADYALVKEELPPEARAESLAHAYEMSWLPKLRQKAKDGFWDVETLDDDYSEPYPSNSERAEIEAELGYKLPASYLELMQSQNGGRVRRNCFPTNQSNNWAEDHIQIVGIFGLGRDKEYTLCGGSGSQFWMQEWEYPDIGIYFADCPSGGHQMVALDYRECGPQGEPKVVYVDQEDDFSILELAPDFASFISGLRAEEEG